MDIITQVPSTAIIQERLNKHLLKLLANEQWFSHFRNNPTADPQQFPYRPNTKKNAVAQPSTYISNIRTRKPSASPNSVDTKYVAIIPAREKNIEEVFLHLITLFTEQSYGKTKTQSSTWVKKNLAIILGVNRPLSLDTEVNREFIYRVMALQSPTKIAIRVYAFFWEVFWQPFFVGDVQNLYPAKQAFLMIKIFSPANATRIRETFEGLTALSTEFRQLINYQMFRNHLLHNIYTRQMIEHFFKHSPQAPIYIWCGDSDAEQLKCEIDGEGLFSHYDHLIAEKKSLGTIPDIMSTGYRVSHPNMPLLTLAIEIDMKIRQQMAPFFPPYFPEPNLVFRIKNPEDLKKFSFSGNGKTLESLRLLQNGLRLGLITYGNWVFGSCGQLTTTIPDRMETQSFTRLRLTHIPTKPGLQALRSRVIQTHAFPRVWANQIYPFLHTRTTVSDFISALTKLYNIFHPISLIFSYYAIDQVENRFSARYYKEVLSFYEEYIHCILAIEHTPDQQKQIIESFTNDKKYSAIKNNLLTFVHERSEELSKAKENLQDLMQKMPQEQRQAMIEQITSAAVASGRAIFSQLPV